MSDTSYNTDTDDYSQTSLKCPTFYRSREEQEKYDMVRMCSVAISTVMMMASHSYKDITTDHVKYMEIYFRNLKEEDKYPHNITRILQILDNLRKSGIIEDVKMEETNIEANDNDDISLDDLIN